MSYPGLSLRACFFLGIVQKKVNERGYKSHEKRTRRTMKILYDHQTFAMQEYGGISRYFIELMNQFRINKEMGVSFELALHYSNNEYLPQYPSFKYHRLFPDCNCRGKGPFLNFVNKPYSRTALLKGNHDLVHPTYYDPYYLKYLRGKSFVITVHDMIHELYPQSFPKYDRTRAYKRLVIGRASAIIAVSQNTKEDVLTFYDVDPAKIEVIYHGSSFQIERVSFAQKDRQLDEKYLLFVGNRRQYKNFNFFITSVASILQNNPDLKVICAGGGAFSEDEQKLLERLSIQNQVVQVRTDDDGLKRLYSKAIAFIFPSLYEGFGIPVLEAFACRCPALLSNTGSLPEVGGDAALYFDPTDSESLRSAITDVLEDEKLRDKLIHAGLKQLGKFSWERTAWETKIVYEKSLP
ncbi:MAG TPA: glycosyltransferase family 1 protein [Methanoregulaceae archaeon]|nr:glycosyltransferase family 1 protein [Methanoregulaceae archaeon]HPD10798.1 glycosyltransferase family 1 protein [Methanoregulaceae archaeon]HRU31451.1 glycosyltransferase family 1 protein [Methanoregulaceae archaeon]